MHNCSFFISNLLSLLLESVWDVPKDGFVSLEEQKKKEKIKEMENRKKMLENPNIKKISANKKKEKDNKKFIKTNVPKVKPNKPQPPIEFGPAPKGQPFGTWKSAFE